MGYAHLLAQASESGDGSAIVGFFIIVGFLWAICAACTKKKTYDVRMGGTIRER